MEKALLRNTCRVLVGLLPAAMALTATASAADADRTIRRAAAERAIGGLTVEERAVQQNELLNRLTAEMPQGALNSPIRVELTDQNRADLALPYEIGTPLRIGVVNSISPRVEVLRGKGLNQGEIRETRDGGFVWSMSITSPEAQAIRVHFTNFSLPENAEMFFFSPNGTADGPYVGTGRNNNGDFWTRSLSSDTGVIQLRFTGQGARGARQEISFVVSELAHISSRQHLQGGGEVSAASDDTWPCSDNVACLEDANCVSGTPADAAKDAVAKMEWIRGPFVNTCSGGLLADTVAATQIPYFLTANHCFKRSISNLETWFNYTTDVCNGTCPHNILTGGAPPSDTVGITVVASSSTSDFTLGTLDQAPPAGAVFLGWNALPVAFTNGEALHRISNANFGPQVYSQADVDTGSPVCTGLARGNFIYSDTNIGGTMGGSSGSPVVNAASEVVGQLFGCCGFDCADECASAPTNWTVDGAFAVTFLSVAEFLDPQGGGGCTSDAECDDGDACNGAETCVDGSCQAGTEPACGLADGCCGAGCDSGNDPDCVSCNLGQLGDSCVDAADCCSNKCKGRPGAKVCK